MTPDPLIILINGPLGIGKSTLAEALGEALDHAVTLDGDALVALNPPPADAAASLADTVALLVAHHLRDGYRRFVINHYWASAEDLGMLGTRLREAAPGVTLRTFRLVLPRAENLRRIARRQSDRAIDETAFEARQFEEEYKLLSESSDEALGTPFDASGPPDALVAEMLATLGIAPVHLPAQADRIEGKIANT